MAQTRGNGGAATPSAWAEPAPAPAEDDRWPWACLCCGSVLYHDVEFCRDCGPSPWTDDSSDESGRLLAWIRASVPAP